jgi:hypothetical protein
MVRTITAEDVEEDSSVVLTRCGGYCYKYLCSQFPYIEACIMDTAIDEGDVWEELSSLTQRIEKCSSIPERMSLRVTRAKAFLDYAFQLETSALDRFPEDSPIRTMKRIRKDVLEEAEKALEKARKHYSE